MTPNKIKRIKKRRRFFAFLVLLFLIITIGYFLFRAKDYEITYEENGFSITEKYDKNKKLLSFKITKDNHEYFWLKTDTRFLAKHLIYQIEEFTTENETCLKISSNKLRFVPLCSSNNEQVSIELTSQEMQDKVGYKKAEFGQTEAKKAYNMEINNLLYHDFYIWNYRGFYHINSDTEEEISLFQKDIYTPNLITKVDNYLFIPDYDANYYFTKVFILNMENNKVITWNLDTPIYFDSAILGVYDNKIYLIDKHEKIEWEIDLKKQKMTKVSNNDTGKIYDNGFKDVSLNSLLYQDMTFKGVQPYTYIIDNGLYYEALNKRIKISQNTPKTIVYYDDEWVYYLVDDILYASSFTYGETKILQYFEWNFNYQNVIFIN